MNEKKPFRVRIAGAKAPERPFAGEKAGCLLCGKPLVYAEVPREQVCAICGGHFHAQEACEGGHYVCDRCHQAAGEGVLALLGRTAEKSPAALLEQLWRLPEIHLFGPEHHWLLPCVLLTCYHNCGGKLDLNAALKTAWERGRQVSGGSCGYWGACGAAVGMGIYFSILYGSTPLNAEVWHIPQALTGDCLHAIAALGGPRCCKRTCRIAVELAVRETQARFQVAMPLRWKPCAYCARNRECLGSACPYYQRSVTI